MTACCARRGDGRALVARVKRVRSEGGHTRGERQEQDPYIIFAYNKRRPRLRTLFKG
jgi:hypothetical protein